MLKKISFLMVLAFSGCATVEYNVIHVAPQFKNDTFLKSKMIIATDPDMTINDFDEEFNKIYQDSDNFAMKHSGTLQKLFASKTDNESIDVATPQQQGGIIEAMKAGRFADKALIDADYILYVNHVNISMVINSGYKSSKDDQCAVNCDVTVFDVTANGTVLNFSTSGQASVVLFNKKDALKSAISKVDEKIVDYFLED